jgi:tetratricopeptide (TPR) repeat protein
MSKQRIILLLSVILLAAVVAPQPVPAQTSKGIELCDAWKYKEAEKVLRQAVKGNPKDNQANYYLGFALLMQNKYEEALKIFLKVSADMDKQPQPTPAEKYRIQIQLARTRLGLKQNDEALKNLDAAEKAQPNGVDAHVYRGAYYLNLKKVDKATAELEKAIGLDKNNPYAHYYAGRAYLQSGDPARAVEQYKIFLELAPLAPEAEAIRILINQLC